MNTAKLVSLNSKKMNSLSLAVTTAFLLMGNPSISNAQVVSEITGLTESASGSAKATSTSLGTIYSVTGLNEKQLQLEYSIQTGKNFTSRFQQYHLGVPVWQQSVVAEIDGNPFSGSVKKISGKVIENLEKEIPVINVTVLEQDALAKARLFSGAKITTADRADLYVLPGQNEPAQLVYLVSFESTDHGAKARPSFIVSASTGNIMQHWDSKDNVDGFGPAGFLRPVVDSLSASGWSKKKIETLLEYTQKVYLIDGTPMAKTQCGAMEAAADLGYEAADVRLAFMTPGACRSNARKFRLAELDAPDLVTAQQPGPLAKATTTSTVAPTYGAWAKMTNSHILGLEKWSTPDKLRAQFRNALPVPGVSLPSSTRLTTAYINNFNAAENDSRWGTNNDICGSYCVEIRPVVNGTNTHSDAYVSWSAVPGYGIREVPNKTSGTLRVQGDVLWQSATTTETGWSITKSQSISYGMSFAVPDTVGSSLSISVQYAQGSSGSVSKTLTENYSVPTVRVPKNCTLVMQLQQRWKDDKSVYYARPEVRGTARGRSYPNYNRNEYHSRNTSAVFASLPSEPGYTVNVDRRKFLTIRANYWGRRNDGAPSSTNCTLLPD